MRFVLPVVFIALPLAALPVEEQGVKIPVGLEKLGAKAAEVVDVSLDGPLLALASRFFSEKDPDQVNVKRIVSGLKGVYVKSFEFDTKDQYKESDVEELRAQLKPPSWSRIVGARSKKNGENSEIYLKTEGGQISGLAVIVTEPKALTIVNIVGSIRPEDLRFLEQMGIPKINLGPVNKDDKKKEEQQ